MNYDEFLNVFLPATNPGLRDYCLYGYRVPSQYTHPSRPLPIAVASMAVRILEREKNLIRRRHEIRIELFKNVEHEKTKSFSAISRG